VAALPPPVGGGIASTKAIDKREKRSSMGLEPGSSRFQMTVRQEQAQPGLEVVIEPYKNKGRALQHLRPERRSWAAWSRVL